MSPRPQMLRHPFAELIGLRLESAVNGSSVTALDVHEALLNPHGVLHGAVMYALADTGMGAAVYSLLGEGESCATIEIKLVHLAPLANGRLSCTTEILHRGRRAVILESELRCEGALVAKALGTYSVLGGGTAPAVTGA